MDLHLKNKVAIVTGGSRGLGRAVCLALAAEGAKIAVNYYRNPEAGIDLGDEAAELVKVIRAGHGVDALAVPADVGTSAEVDQMFAVSEQQLGPVDILVNGSLLATGEVVVVDDHFAVRITKLLNRVERLKKVL